MSLRPEVDQQRIARFLRELGRAFRHPARLYVVGGTSLVLEGLRQSTLDIDYAIEVENAYHGELMRQIARLKDQLAVNAEQAAPGDFIPLPSGWRERARFIDRFGELDVFHYDPVSTALSKLVRGHEQDLADVRLLIGAGLTGPEEIRTAWAEVAAHLPDRGWSSGEIAEVKATIEDILRGDQSARP